MLSALALTAPADLARAGEGDSDGGKPGLWLVTIGGWATLEPQDEGSKRYGPGFRPLFSINKPGDKQWLVLPNDSLDYDLIETDNFRAGPAVNFRWSADGRSTPRGMTNWGFLDVAVETGVFAEYWPAHWLRTRIEAREVVVGSSGLVSDVSADLVLRPGPWTITAGPRLSLADHRYLRANYAEPSSQGLGVRYVGAGSMLAYKWSENWTTTSFVEYQHLTGAAARSPFIDVDGTREQVVVGLGATYTFTVGR